MTALISLTAIVPYVARFSHFRHQTDRTDLPDKSAAAVIDGFEKVRKYFDSKFSDVFKSITTDNGSEFAELSKLEEDSNTLVYYAHPYSSWEKGSNERHTRLVRRFIAKGERISDYGINAIERIGDLCNNLPRKMLGYKTPDELFEANLDEIYSA